MYKSFIRMLVGLEELPSDESQLATLLAFCDHHKVTAPLAYHEDIEVSNPTFQSIVNSQAIRAASDRRKILFEINRVERAFLASDIMPVIIKGGAYFLCDHPAGNGRLVSDLDILVADHDIMRAEQTLLRHGWIFDEKTDNKRDQAYYRSEMHELPPMIHHLRKTHLDVHFRLTPRFARYQLDHRQMMDSAQNIDGRSVKVFTSVDQFIYAAFHAFCDGELQTPVRSLIELWQLYSSMSEMDKDAIVPRAEQVGGKVAILTAFLLFNRYFDAKQSNAIPFRSVCIVAAFTMRVGGISVMQHFARYIFIARGHFLRAPVLKTMKHLSKKYLFKQ